MTPLRPEQMRVIPLGLDSTWFDPPPFDREAARKMLDLPGEPKIVGCFGRIDPLKGQEPPPLPPSEGPKAAGPKQQQQKKTAGDGGGGVGEDSTKDARQEHAQRMRGVHGELKDAWTQKQVDVLIAEKDKQHKEQIKQLRETFSESLSAVAAVKSSSRSGCAVS